MKQRFKEIHPLCLAGLDPEPLFRSLISTATLSRLQPFERLGNTMKLLHPEILAAYRSETNNSIAENINSQIQAAIVMARGFNACVV